MSCHAGRVNRKKFSGLPKIGSTTPPVVRGAYQKSASVGHSAIMPAPVAAAMTSETPSAMRRRTRLNRQLHRLSADVNRVTARHVREMRPLQRQKRSVQNEKCGRCKSREDSPLQAQCFPEHVPVAERPEPERVHVIRQRGPAAEEDAGKDGENEKETTATARPRRMRRRPVYGIGLGHYSTPFLPAFPLSEFQETVLYSA
jgi:hypothetical protein